jgi:hypothetical protein
LLAGVCNEIYRRFPTNFRPLPQFDIASAPLTYVAAHTARLATKVE